MDIMLLHTMAAGKNGGHCAGNERQSYIAEWQANRSGYSCINKRSPERVCAVYRLDAGINENNFYKGKP